MTTMSTSVGRPLDRVDGRAKVTGAAQYAAEVRLPDMAYAVLVTSTIARGRIIGVETEPARRVGGVHAVLTHENAPRLREPDRGDPHAARGGALGERSVPLAGADVHFAGQPVAVVVAETLEQAEHAASLVRVRYAPERPVLQIADAMATAARPDRYQGEPLQHRRGDPDAALRAEGTVRIERTYTTPVETHVAMEPGAAVASWADGMLTVYDATQWVLGVRATLAEMFGLAPERVRVHCPFTGGAFGSKGQQWPHVVLAAMAARVTGRPVKLVLTRAQTFTGMGHRPPTVQTVTLAATAEGRLTAIRHATVQPTSPLTDYIESCALGTSAVLYACPNVDLPHTLVRVNVAAPTYMRAPGEAPGTFAIECAMDELAEALALDPLELRLRNYAERDPASGRPWSSKHLRECYALGAERFGWARRTPAPGSMRDGGLLVGWGMATAVYPANRWPASASVRLFDDGCAVVRSATHDLGTGSYTVFAQVAADALGLPAERVAFELGDTAFPPAPLSAGSNSAASVSEAIVAAARAVRGKVSALSAFAGAPADGAPFADVLKAAGVPSVDASASVPGADDGGPVTFESFGAQFCEVAIDPVLPRVRLRRVVSVHDVGRVLNHKLARSQIMGGVVMGAGMALMEHTVYDPRSGRPVTDNLADYHVPVCADIGAIEVDFIEHPDTRFNTLGCRGLGEIGITGVAAAIANAVYHATGRRVRDLPMTPDILAA
jgi:xanthine dehydrogenase YagR molybdenum-binding subunit